MNLKLIVVDTNILISAILSPDGTARKALDKVYNQFKIAQSEQTYQELKTRINKPKFDKYISDEERKDFLNTVLKKSQFIKVKSKITDCRDPEDNKFLELSIDAKSLFLITGDKDLLVLKSLEEYQDLIITPREFIDLN